MSRKNSIPVRLITKSQADALVTNEDVIQAVEDTFYALGHGQVAHSEMEPLWMDEPGGNMLLALPSHLRHKKIAGIKWVNMYTHHAPNEPASYGNLLILSQENTGRPYAIIEATSITTMRTGGGHAVVSAKYLAKKDSHILTLIGCGEEAKSAVRGFLTAFSALKTLQVFDLSPLAMESVREEFGSRINVICCASAEEAVANTDILVMATTARKPIVKFEWLPKGVFVAGLYSFNDLDPECSRKADKWILGSRHTDTMHIIEDRHLKAYSLSSDDVYADLGDIVAGTVPGRENNDEIIVYTHMGMGALDVAVGNIIYERAIEKNIGTDFDFIS